MEENENSRDIKRWACDNFKCPCRRPAKNAKQKVGTGKHEKYWFTEEQEQEWGWESSNPKYKDCCHYQVDENGKYIPETRTKGKGQPPKTGISLPGWLWKAALVIILIVVGWLCWPSDCSGMGGSGDEPATSGEAEAVRYLQRILNETFPDIN